MLVFTKIHYMAIYWHITNVCGGAYSDWGLEIGTGDWDWGLGLGIGIGDWDWGLRLGLGTGIDDWD